MSIPSPPTSHLSEELLAQVGWVRALALQLAGDAHLAEDIAQDAFLVALSKPDCGQTRLHSMRHWLGAVVRKLCHTRRRAERRRLGRETLAAPRESELSTLDLVERAASQRELVAALLSLPDPYRSTLLLRFFEERSPREVARRMEVAESTVATRTAEGLQRLREGLTRGSDVESGTWLASLLPLLRWPSKPQLSASLVGITIMGTTFKFILVGGLVFGMYLALRSSPVAAVDQELGATFSNRSVGELQAPEDLARIGGEPPVRLEQPVRRNPEQVAVPREASTAAPDAAQAPAHITRGRVIDMDANPVPDVEVRRPGEHLPRDSNHAAFVSTEKPDPVLTAADGSFEVEGVVHNRLVVRDERYVTVCPGIAFNFTEPIDPVIVVAPRVVFAGLVLDQVGQPIAGASLRIAIPDVPLPAGALTGSAVRTGTSTSAADGSFRFENGFECEGLRLHLRAPGFAEADFLVPSEEREALRIVLRRGAGADEVAGLVLDAQGSPAEGALVSTGSVAVRCDSEGRFILSTNPWGHVHDRSQALRLTAVRRGELPAVLDLPSIAEAEVDGWPEDIVLLLGGKPKSIHGRVLDEHGEPLAGISVEADWTPFGMLEGLEGGYYQERRLEEILGRGPTQTDAQGRFELDGLLDRDYTIDAMQGGSQLQVISGPIAAGSTGVLLELDRSSLGTLQGQVLDSSGAAVVGVRVAISRKRTNMLAIGRSDTTDAEGHFRIDGVTTKPVYIRIEGNYIVPELFRELDPGADTDKLQLVVGRRCQLQVDFGAWVGKAEQLHLVDGAGQRLMMMRVSAGSVGEAPFLLVREAESPIVAMPDTAVSAILTQAGVELARFPLRPRVGELFRLEL